MKREKLSGAFGLLVLWALSKRSSSPARGVQPAPAPGSPVRPVRGSPSDLLHVWPYTLSEQKRRWTTEALHEDAAPHFAELLEHAKSLGFSPRIADAVRSPREQREERAMYGSKVDCSWHLGGRALDVELHGGGTTWHPDYAVLGEWWKAKGGEWGGTFSDYGQHGDFRHFEWAPGLGYPKQHGLCDTDYTGVAAYWRKSTRNAPPVPPNVVVMGRERR